MSNDNKSNLKDSHGANSSLNSSIINLSTETKKTSKYLPNPKHRKNDVTGAITHFFVKQAVATDDSSGYYIDLSRKHASGKPDRYSLAFFVPVIGVDSQSLTKLTDTAPQAHLSATRGHSLISIANQLLTDYDGLTLQNKIAERRICGAVACVTESKTRHPILLPYSVAFTQKITQGVIHHG